MPDLSKHYEIGDTFCYPGDYGFATILEIPESAALEIVSFSLREVRQELNSSYWVNKKVYIVSDGYFPAIGIYKHDFTYYIVQQGTQ